MESLKEFRKDFEPELLRFFEARLTRYAAITADAEILETAAYAKKLVEAGGKRVRPYVAWLTYRGFGGKKWTGVLPALVALEMFHVYGLMHDDVIDRGTDRHGVSTTHRFVTAKMEGEGRPGDLVHVGEGQAILLGDLLFSWVCELVSSLKLDASSELRVRERFFRMVDEVLLGQMLDVSLATRPSASLELIDEKMRLKTASYTFVRPMQIGAALAGVDGKADRFCEAFGLALGLAFQIQDDLMDLTSSAETLGKTVFSDLADRQQTYFTQFVFEQGTEAQKEELRSLLGTRLTESDRPRVTRLFEESGAFAHGISLMESYFQQAANALQRAPIEEKEKQELADIVIYLRTRLA